MQRVLLAIYLPLTTFFAIADRLFPGDYWVKYVKFTTVLTIFLAAFVLEKLVFEQKLLTLAIFFTVTGDFCLNFGSTLVDLKQTLIPLGMLGYAIAYILLILAFQKQFKIDKVSFLALIPVLGVYIPVFIKLSSFISGFMFYAAFAFGLILCYMAWTAICTLFRGYFSVKISRFIALAGYLIFVSDMAVAHSLFNPAFQSQFVPWLTNLIWITFIPAWTLIAIIISEKNLTLINQSDKGHNI